MSVERTAGGTSHIDVLDRVLDKGIVIDAWVQVSLVGIDLLTVKARVIVASIATYLQHSDALAEAAVASTPPLFSKWPRTGGVPSRRPYRRRVRPFPPPPAPSLAPIDLPRQRRPRRRITDIGVLRRRRGRGRLPRTACRPWPRP